MILVICDPLDQVALEFRWALIDKCSIRVEIVTPEEIVYSPSFSHRIESESIDCSVEIPRLGVLASEQLTGVVNRFTTPPRGHLPLLTVKDRDYAYQELFAAVSSWLAGLQCPVISRPTAVSLSGPNYSPILWTHMAAVAGLATADECTDLDNPPAMERSAVLRVIIFEGRVYGPKVTDDMQEACVRLLEYSGSAILEACFSESSGEQRTFKSATPMVDFSIGGASLAGAIATFFGLV